MGIIERTVYRSVDYGRGNLRIAGIFGFALFPAYWVVWKYLSPEPYESLSLRVAGSLLCIPLLFEERLLARFPRFFPFYWYVVLIYALPFFFTFMLLKNGADLVWGMSLLAAVVVLALVIADWLNFVVISTIGTIAAVISVQLTGGPPLLSPNLPAYVFILFFLAVATNVLNFNWRNVERNRNLAIQAWSNSAIHEVQTPLASILVATRGLRQHIQRKHKDKRLLYFVDEAERVCKNGLTTIRMMLLNTAFTRADRASYTQTEATACITDAIERFPFDSEADRKLVKWRGGPEFVFIGSPELLVHIIFNLIKNAITSIKGSGREGGQIEIRTALEGGRSAIVIRDTGPGIAAKHLPRIFERYFSTSKDYQGTGNGLAFCKLVMESFGGSIRCASVEGEFAEFTLTFPQVPQASSGSAHEGVRKQALRRR